MLTRRAKRHRPSDMAIFIETAGVTVAALVVALAIRWVDDRTQWTVLGFGIEGARGVIGALASSLLTIIVFTFSILLLGVQLISAQLTPRILARLFQDRLTRATTTIFVFAWLYSMTVLGRIEDRVPQLPVAVAIALSIACIAMFLMLVRGSVKRMRPVTVLTDVANDTREVIDAVYPEPFTDASDEHDSMHPDPASARRTIRHEKRPGAVLSIDVDGVMRAAQRGGCAIEIVPKVGDFVATGENFFRIYGPGADSIDERELRDCVDLGPERTLEQDPAFGFRIIVDIASKALSPAINDPTTGVLAIDQLHHLLHLLAHRKLDTGIVRDVAGDVRVVYRTPDWEDFVTLAATEVRVYGATNPQVTRRLQAMFERLEKTVPAQRAPALREELAMLERTIERTYADPADRTLASSGDLQGFGSRNRNQPAADRRPPETS